MKNFDLKRRLLRGAYFAFFGPLAGLIIVLISLLCAYLYSAQWLDLHNLGRDATIAGLVALFGVGYAYIIGVVPAFMTGVTTSFATKKSNEILLATVSGGLISFVGCKVTIADLHASLIIAGVGAASGFLCVILRHRKAP